MIKMHAKKKSLAVFALILILSLVACNAFASRATPDPRLDKIQVLATQTHLIGNDINVVGTLKNGDAQAHDITLRADFYDPSGNSLGKAEGVAEDVAEGATVNFEIHGQVDATRFGTAQVTIVSLNERK